MSYTPPKRSLPASPEEPHADFNWPPTDGQLAQNFGTLQRETAFDGTGVKTADPSVAPAPASSEPPYAEFDSPIAVAQSETALDGTSAGETAAEIAHLQALIEGLTHVRPEAT